MCPTGLYFGSACQRRLGSDSQRLPYPRTTVEGDFVEVAASWTDEGDGELPSNDCSDGEFIRQGDAGACIELPFVIAERLAAVPIPWFR